VLPWLLGAGWRQVGEVSALLTPWLSLNFFTSPLSTIFVVVRKQWVALLFSLVYMAVPLIIIWVDHASMLHTVLLVSMSMTVLLMVYLGLVLWVSRVFDRQATPNPAESLAWARDVLGPDATAQQQRNVAERNNEALRVDAGDDAALEWHDCASR